MLNFYIVLYASAIHVNNIYCHDSGLKTKNEMPIIKSVQIFKLCQL